MKLKLLTCAAIAVVAMLLTADPAFAQATTTTTATAAPAKFTGIGAGIGIGLAIVGAGIGIGLVGFAALSGIARQPEQSGTIRGAMILLAALVEGAALIGAVLCFVMGFIGT